MCTNHLMGRYKENRARYFSLVPSDRIWECGNTLKHRRFTLYIRKHFFVIRVKEHGTGCPEWFWFLSLEIFESHLVSSAGCSCSRWSCTRWTKRALHTPTLLWFCEKHITIIAWFWSTFNVSYTYWVRKRKKKEGPLLYALKNAVIAHFFCCGSQ